MTKNILVNRIDARLNYEAIDRDFDILKISCDFSGKRGYGRAVNKIYKSIKPLALCFIGKGIYACLTQKKSEYHLQDEHFTVTSVRPKDLGKSSIVKLLIGALPSLTRDHNRSSEGAGLYYLSDVEIIKGVKVLRTHEVKVGWEQKRHLVLQIQSATFTPVEYHTNAQGDLYSDCTHLPRIKFDRWAQEISRSRNGEYIKKKHRDRNMSSEMVSLDSKNPLKFWRSKMGTLAVFMDDADRYLSDYVSLNFESLSSDYRIRFKDRNIKEAYDSINELLSTQKLNIVNLTNINIEPLLLAFERDGFAVSSSDRVNKKSLNLAVHYNTTYYEGRRLTDPYLSLHSDAEAVVQSVYPETLFRNGKLSQAEYEACKKELFVKWETRDRELKLIIPKGDWLFIFCNAPDDEDPQYLTLTCRSGKLSFELQNIETAEQRFLLDLPRTMKNGERAVVNLDTDDTFLFEDTGYVAMPEYQRLSKVMKELEDGYLKGIKRIWIEEFISLLKNKELVPANPKLVKQRLTQLLTRNPNIETFYKNDLFNDRENPISYKGSLQFFFDWITVEKGLRLGASLKGENAPYIEASLGLFYNENESLYFVGEKDNVKSLPKFCRIRRILTNTESVPIDLLKMMEVFHIRHKQATIYPFPFKHLREASKI